MCTDKKDLTSAAPVGTMKEGAGGPPKEVGARKTRRADGPQAASLNDFILALHTFAREWQQTVDDAEGSVILSAMLDELAHMLKSEYDIRHG